MATESARTFDDLMSVGHNEEGHPLFMLAGRQWHGEQWEPDDSRTLVAYDGPARLSIIERENSFCVSVDITLAAGVIASSYLKVPSTLSIIAESLNHWERDFAPREVEEMRWYREQNNADRHSIDTWVCAFGNHDKGELEKPHRTEPWTVRRQFEHAGIRYVIERTMPLTLPDAQYDDFTAAAQACQSLIADLQTAHIGLAASI